MEITLTYPLKFKYNPNPIYDAMQEQGLIGKQLAKACGCTNVHLSRVLNGRGHISVDLIKKICQHLNLPESAVLTPCDEVLPIFLSEN